MKGPAIKNMRQSVHVSVCTNSYVPVFTYKEARCVLVCRSMCVYSIMCTCMLICVDARGKPQCNASSIDDLLPIPCFSGSLIGLEFARKDRLPGY